MSTSYHSRNRRLAALIFVSFAFFASAVILRLGLGATPYDASDSGGRTMGFNDQLSAKHYLIILQNFSPAQLLKAEYLYEWVLLGAHVAGALLLLRCGSVCSRLTRWYFACQAVLFPLGIPALLIFPFLVSDIFTGRIDREGFIDIPFILIASHPVWVVTSLIITFSLRGASLEFSLVWSAIKQAGGTGARTFARAMR